MNKETIDKLYERAERIGRVIGSAVYIGDKHNGFREGNFTPELVSKPFIPEAGVVRFNFGKSTFVEFRDISVSKQYKSKIHEPVLGKKSKKDVTAYVLENHSDNVSISRTYDFTASESKSIEQSVGVGLEVEMTQSVTYGGFGAEGTSEFRVLASTEYNKAWGEDSSTERTTSTSIEVPPKTKATISIQEFKSDFSQLCEYWCDLNHSVRLKTKAFDITWSSMDEMWLAYSGQAPNNIHFGGWFRDSNKIEQHALDWAKQNIWNPLDVHYSYLLKFSNANTGDVKISTEKL